MSPSDPAYDYSTLEAASTTHVGHSTLEHYNRPPSIHQEKIAYTKVEVGPEDGDIARAPASFRHRRVYGMKIKVVIIAGIIIFLVALGAVVGGVLGTRTKDKAPSSSASSDSSTPSPPEPGGNTTTTTNTIVNGTSVPVPNLFASASDWHNFEITNLLPNKTHTIQASYDPSTLTGGPIIVEAPTSNTSAYWPFQEWQFLAVPAEWPNSTVELPEGGDWGEDQMIKRTFFMSNKRYGPDVRLCLDNQGEKWKSIVAETNTSLTFPELKMKPKDFSDAGQYWFVIEYSCKSDQSMWQRCWKVFNKESGINYRMWGNEKQETGWGMPMMGTGELVLEGWDIWNIWRRGKVDVTDGGWEWVIV